MSDSVRRLHFVAPRIRNGADYSVMASYDPGDAHASILLTLRPALHHCLSVHLTPEQAAALAVQLRTSDYVSAHTANHTATVHLGDDGAAALAATLQRALRDLARLVMMQRAAEVRVAA